MTDHFSDEVGNDPLLALGSVMHAANSLPVGSTAIARLLYPICTALDSYWYQSTNELNELAWAQTRLVSTPHISWKLGDTLDAPLPHPRIQNVLLLPQNTSMDSSSKLLQEASKRFNAVHFEKFKSMAAVKLGDVFPCERGGANMPWIAFLVCREAGNPESKALDQCLAKLPSAPGMRYVLPIWRAEDNLGLWLDVLVAWQCSGGSSSSEVRQPMLVNFAESQRTLALEFERKLIQRGVLVGRDNEPHAPLDGSLLEDPQTAQQLFQLVGPNGPLTPNSYGQWLRSGIRLPKEAWVRHIDALRSIAAP